MTTTQYKENLHKIFKSDFRGADTFIKEVLRPLFKKVMYIDEDDMLSRPEYAVYRSHGLRCVKKVAQISDLFDVIDVYDVTLDEKVLVSETRVYIQNFVRSVAQVYAHAFMLFHYKDVKDKDWRFSYMYKEDTVKSTTSARRFTYLFGENVPCRTAVERFTSLLDKRIDKNDILEAFSVEALSYEFFKGYKERYEKFCQYLYSNCTETSKLGNLCAKYGEKALRDYVKKLLGRLVFLQFLQKKGWMGVPKNNKKWEGGDKAYMFHLIEKNVNKDRILTDILEPLFFNTLNEKRINNLVDNRLGADIKIPYLNGGLFDRDDIDKETINFPYDYFKDLMDFFAKYNFTIDENDPSDFEIGIDPEMLGHIFENLLEENRKAFGMFYTPKEIVQYMSQECVCLYLKSHTQDILHNSIDELIKHKFVDKTLKNRDNAKYICQLLKEIKVCDPAIGSGAFPMGILNVLFSCRLLLYPHTGNKDDFSWADVKRDIIHKNIYGVDIEKGAVDIARLRFWLALIVDEKEPCPLPNFDYKIMRGNSLLENYNGVDLSSMTERKADGEISIFENNLDCLRKQLRDRLVAYYDTSDHTRKKQLQYEISCIVKEQLAEQKIVVDLTGIDIAANSKFFLWHTWFHDVFKNGGFDIVIGNPPYGAKFSDEEKQIYKVNYSDVHMRTPESFCYFTSLAFKLCKRNSDAIVSYIVPNNLLFQNENEKTRRLLAAKNTLVRAINLGDNTFENATVPTCVFIAKSKESKCYNLEYSDYRNTNVKDIKWDSNIENIQIEKLKTVPSMVIGMSNSEIDILNLIKKNGITIDSIADEMACGISTGGDKIFKVSEITINQYQIEREILHPALVGSNLSKFHLDYQGDSIIYTTRETNISDYTFTNYYLYQFYDKLSQRSETRKGVLPWYALNRNRTEELFIEPKIIMRQTSDSIISVFDEKGYYVLDSILVLKVKKEMLSMYNYKFISTVLNSKVVNFLYKMLTQEEGRVFAQVKPVNVRKLYLPRAEMKEQRLMSMLYDYMAYLRNPKSLHIDEVIGNQFVGDYFERIIDGCVFELFFKEHMIEREVNIIDFLHSIIMPCNGTAEPIASAFNMLYKTDNEVRTRINLFVSRSPEYLKHIIQS